MEAYRRWMGTLPVDGVLCDVGCGAGAFIRVLPRMRTMLCVDLSPNMLKTSAAYDPKDAPYIHLVRDISDLYVSGANHNHTRSAQKSQNRLKVVLNNDGHLFGICLPRAVLGLFRVAGEKNINLGESFFLLGGGSPRVIVTSQLSTASWRICPTRTPARVL